MRRIVSVSLGSSRRDKTVTTEFAGQEFSVSRVGTDGDIKKAVALIKELDGDVDAIGIGGIDLYLSVGMTRYVLRGALPMLRAAKKTPVVDGSGLKNTLERQVITKLATEHGVDFKGKTVLLVCALDRFGMAESLVEQGADLIVGDLMFTLKIPIPLYSIKALDRVARFIAPAACKLPINWLYPMGKDQDRPPRPRFGRYYERADIIAGDYHLIHRHMPDRLQGKMVITNTVTDEDVEVLRQRGVSVLVTTTPELNGRSFATNVMEGVLVSLADKPVSELDVADYEQLLDRIGFKPRIERLEV